MTLNDTAPMMSSSDYKERFKAEYYQTRIRCSKLMKMLKDWDNGVLKFKPTCPRSLFTLQVRAMHDYLAVLEARAKIEGIKL